MIQLGEDKYIPALKEMWKLCFPTDSDEFIAFYFDKIYKNDEVLIYLENEKPIAALQMIPYPIKIEKAIHLGGYISGAMTHPAHRKRGYMEKLLKESFFVMKSKNFVYSFLIPQEKWLFDFYGKYGYFEAFPVNERQTITDYVQFPNNPHILRDKSVNIYTQMKEVDINDFYIIYSRFLMKQDNVVLKSKQQVTNILLNFFDEKGILFANDWGVAFVYSTKEETFIKEFFSFDDEIKGEFLKTIKEYYQQKITILNDYSAPFSKYKGMIKNLNETAVSATDIYMSMMLD